MLPGGHHLELLAVLKQPDFAVPALHDALDIRVTAQSREGYIPVIRCYVAREDAPFPTVWLEVVRSPLLRFPTMASKQDDPCISGAFRC